MDTVSPEVRSRVMAAVRRKGTGPELVVRKMLRGLKVKYVGQAKSLPGTPDFVLGDRGIVIFVQGCFWHRHKATCPLTRTPKSNLAFWNAKFDRNRRRDRRDQRALRAAGWTVVNVWECETRRPEQLLLRLARFAAK